MYNGCVDGLFKARGLWVLTQLPREQRWVEGDRILGKTPLSIGVRGNDDEWRGEVNMCFVLGNTSDYKVLVPKNTIATALCR